MTGWFDINIQAEKKKFGLENCRAVFFVVKDKKIINMRPLTEEELKKL